MSLEGRTGPEGRISSARGRWSAIAALAFLLAVTAAWWALALWPGSDATPEWLARARYVCFNTGPDGMPDASGWLLLVGQPIGMAALLMVVGGRELRDGVSALLRPAWGKAALAACACALLLGLGAAAQRVATASEARGFALPGDELPPDTYPRLDREAPPLELVDQSGRLVELGELRGRPALVTFAFGNCHTLCPAVVRQTLDAREQVRLQAETGQLDPGLVPRVVIVTLDPWRDTPSRLPHVARHWELGATDHVLSGAVPEVEATLDAWGVARKRDEQTGDVVHPPLVYVLDSEGRIAFASSGGTTALAALLQRL